MIEALRTVLIEYGSGFPAVDISLVATAFAFIALVKVIFFAPKLKLPPELERVGSLLGKVDKVEREIGELRAEILRELAKRQNKEESAAPPQPISEPEVCEAPACEVTEEEKKNLVEALVVIPSPVPEPTPPPAQEAPVSLNEKLGSTRKSFLAKFKSFFSSANKIDDSLLEEVEATLISSDLGPKLSGKIVSLLKSQALAEGSKEFTEPVLYQAVETELLTILARGPQELIKPSRKEDGPMVILVVGVNGVGKTTSVAKLGTRYKAQGSKVLFVAADTFRAGAVDQLKTWGDRIGVEVISGPEGSKPQSVVFDGMKRAQETDCDVVIIDTAGRLHNKSSLMQELEGVKNSIRRHFASAPHETWLVVDGSTGGNAVSQAREFNSVTPLTGVIVTKLDGTPRGGVVAAIADEIGIPVRYIGVGEKSEDLRPFNAEEFVSALVRAA
jgi:fused signal recognition particle receptor